MPEIDPGAPCPCGSGRRYEQCCQPCHDGSQPAASPEALMRSRYCAYVLELWRYLYNSWDPQTRPTRKSLADSGGTDWQGLEIVATTGGCALEEEGTVEFKAHWKNNDGSWQSLHERSRFRHHGGKWVYVDGEIFNQ